MRLGLDTSAEHLLNVPKQLALHSRLSAKVDMGFHWYLILINFEFLVVRQVHTDLIHVLLDSKNAFVL